MSLVSTVGHKNTAHVFAYINAPTFYWISAQTTTDFEMTYANRDGDEWKFMLLQIIEYAELEVT